MKLTELYPSKYLKAEDFEEGQTMLVTMDHIEVEPLGKKQEDKPVLYLRQNIKPLVLNKTNARKMADVVGSLETDDWAGSRVQLYATDVEFQGETVEAIRCKAPGTGTRTRPAQRPPAISSPPDSVRPVHISEDQDLDDDSAPF